MIIGLLAICGLIGLYYFCYMRYNYFAVYYVNNEQMHIYQKNSAKRILLHISNRFSKRSKKVKYFEIFEMPTKTFFISGTAPLKLIAPQKAEKFNKNAYIFLLQLYASIKDPNLGDTTAHYIRKVKKLENIDIIFFKIPKKFIK
jgi:hypothetical protein